MKKSIKIILLSILFLVVFVISALVSIALTGNAPNKLIAVEWNDSIGKIYTDLPYENTQGHLYDLYVSEGLDKSKEQYLILYIHGGSFNSGAKEDGAEWCKYYATHGYIAASLDYSLQTVHEDATLHRMNDEIGNCVKAIKEKCAELGYSVDGMATCGVSAGGTLAMNYAYTRTESSAIPVKFVFQLAGPTDFEPCDWDLLKKVDKIKTDRDFIKMMTGADFTDVQITNGEYRTEIDKISPANLVSAESVPTLCGYGLRDHVIPQNQKVLLVEAFEKTGAAYDYLEFPKSNHGMYADLDVLQRFIDMSLEYCEQYFK